MNVPKIVKAEEDINLENPNKLNDLHKAYIKGKRWKCPSSKSPTGAHHWVESKKGHESSEFTCRYCDEIRKMCNTFSGQMGIVAKKLKKGKVIEYRLGDRTGPEQKGDKDGNG
jgi:hypothetical protein